MPRNHRSLDGPVAGACKIRKRGCPSSSSSSAILQNNRFKRAIMVGKRGGSTTPVPRWKMNAASPSSELCQYAGPSIVGKGSQASVSARKLANALWEMNKIPSPQMSGELVLKENRKEMRGRSTAGRSMQPVSIRSRLSDPSHSPVSDISDRSKSGGHMRVMPLISQSITYNEHNHRDSEFRNSGSLMKDITPTTSIRATKSRLKDLNDVLITSKELLGVLNHISSLEEKSSYSASLVSAIHGKLDHALVRVDQLIQEQRSGRDEVNYLKRQFLQEKSAWRSKEKERITATVTSMMEELESERKLRRRAERLNKKLGLELANMRSSLSKTSKDLENERRSREIIEQICNELVKGIGEDKAEVEEMKRESAKVQEELEKEREMLQLADVWREERVQMKLSEAKFHFEEKNAAVEQLRNELEAFLMENRTKETSGVPFRQEFEYIKTTDQNVDEGDNLGEVEDARNGQDEEDDGSTDSDLHSIELNMDVNNRNYSWSFATGSIADEAKRALNAQKSEITVSDEENISRGRFSLDRGISEELTWNLSGNSLQFGVELDQARASDGKRIVDVECREVNEDAKRYVTVKGLRNTMLAGSKIAAALSLVSPTRQWNKSQNGQDNDDQVGEDSMVDEIIRAVRDSGSKVRLVGNGNTSETGLHIPQVL